MVILTRERARAVMCMYKIPNVPTYLISFSSSYKFASIQQMKSRSTAEGRVCQTKPGPLVPSSG